MVSLLKSLLKSLFGLRQTRDALEDLKASLEQEGKFSYEGIEEAKQAGVDTWVAPTSTMEQKIACLKRWYFKVKQDKPDLIVEDLFILEPEDLTEEEINQWYWGLRVEATRRYLGIVNTSWSKTSVREKQVEEALDDIDIIMDDSTRECCQGVLKYLSP